MLPGEESERLQAHVAAWKAELKPQGAIEEYMCERIANTSWEIERIDRYITAKLNERVRYAQLDLDQAEAEEVEDLTRGLFWDPRGPIALYPHLRGPRIKSRISQPASVDDPLDPASIVRRLEGLYAGCRWLIDRWTDLRRLLEDDLKWQAPDRLKAIRMLGRQPMDLLADERVMMIYLCCDAMEPEAPTSLDDMIAEADAAEMKRIKERLKDRGGDWKKPASPEAGKAVLLGLIDQVMTALTVKLGAHRERREFEAAARRDLLAFDDSPEVESARRHRLAKERLLHTTIATYRKVRKLSQA
jgi:hypothetical protein